MASKADMSEQIKKWREERMQRMMSRTFKNKTSVPELITSAILGVKPTNPVSRNKDIGKKLSLQQPKSRYRDSMAPPENFRNDMAKAPRHSVNSHGASANGQHYFQHNGAARSGQQYYQHHGAYGSGQQFYQNKGVNGNMHHYMQHHGVNANRQQYFQYGGSNGNRQQYYQPSMTSGNRQNFFQHNGAYGNRQHYSQHNGANRQNHVQKTDRPVHNSNYVQQKDSQQPAKEKSSRMSLATKTSNENRKTLVAIENTNEFKKADEIKANAIRLPDKKDEVKFADKTPLSPLVENDENNSTFTLPNNGLPSPIQGGTDLENMMLSAGKEVKSQTLFTPSIGTSTPEEKDMCAKLTTWLEKKGKSIENYSHLKCFVKPQNSKNTSPLRNSVSSTTATPTNALIKRQKSIVPKTIETIVEEQENSHGDLTVVIENHGNGDEEIQQKSEKQASENDLYKDVFATTTSTPALPTSSTTTDNIETSNGLNLPTIVVERENGGRDQIVNHQLQEDQNTNALLMKKLFNEQEQEEEEVKQNSEENKPSEVGTSDGLLVSSSGDESTGNLKQGNIVANTTVEKENGCQSVQKQQPILQLPVCEQTKHEAVVKQKSDENDPPTELTESNLKQFTMNALRELLSLIQIGFPWDSCQEWLTALRRRNPETDSFPQYWECVAALEENLGDMKLAVDSYQRAIIRGAEVNHIDDCLDRLFDKMSALSLDCQPYTPRRESKKKSQKVDMKNIFKSTVIQFALMQQKVKTFSTEVGVSANTLNYIATPVRRSTRSSLSRLNTPQKCVDSLKEVALASEDNNVTFKPNKALLFDD